MKKRYVLLYEGSRVICPECHGLMRGDQLFKTCHDCGKKFKAVDEGVAENELTYEEVVVA